MSHMVAWRSGRDPPAGIPGRGFPYLAVRRDFQRKTDLKKQIPPRSFRAVFTAAGEKVGHLLTFSRLLPPTVALAGETKSFLPPTCIPFFFKAPRFAKDLSNPAEIPEQRFWREARRQTKTGLSSKPGRKGALLRLKPPPLPPPSVSPQQGHIRPRRGRLWSTSALQADGDSRNQPKERLLLWSGWTGCHHNAARQQPHPFFL